MNSRPKKILIAVLLVLSACLFIGTNYKMTLFGGIGMDELMFYLTNGAEGANMSSFQSVVLIRILYLVALLAVLTTPIIFFKKRKTNIVIKLRSKVITIKQQLIKNRCPIIYALIIFIIAFTYFSVSFKIFEYIKSRVDVSSFIEKNYVNPKKVKLSFPEKKRNLIRIYLESMENTIASKNSGGAAGVSLIPELEDVATDKKNTSFSNTNQLGGMLPMPNTTWTVAGMVAQSAGIPLSINLSDHNSMGKFNKFLPGAYSLGDVLNKAGYYQEIMFGSDASFGGRDKYYQQHGNYKINDYKAAIADNRLASNYHVWWGYEDKKLFSYAKDELDNISKLSKPFNLELLTVDTHYVDGYLDPSCSSTKFAEQYKNVYACSSAEIVEFLNWAKKQPFYDNTTIVITGDHLGMQTNFYDEIIAGSNYERTIYNAFINSATKPVKEKNRTFTSFDIYPSVLSSMGVKIKGDKLGLGVNLFSDKKTLAEKYGLDYLNDELSKRSTYYLKNIATTK